MLKRHPSDLIMTTGRMVMRGGFAVYRWGLRRQQPMGVPSTKRLAATGSVGDGHGSSRGIVITTFEQRQWTYCLPLLEAIRESGCDLPIMVVLNGNLYGDHNVSERSRFVARVSQVTGVDLVSLRTMGGMAHNWNLGIRLLGTDSSLVLSDDLLVAPESFGSEVDAAFEVAEASDFALINNSFAHFVFTESVRSKVGMFDERFIGFGEEDGDFVWRFEERLGRKIPQVEMKSIRHVVDPSRGDDVAGIGKYSLANRVFLQEKYSFGSGKTQGVFDEPAIRRVDEVDPDPMHRVRREAVRVLRLESENEIRDWFSSLQFRSLPYGESVFASSAKDDD